MRSPLRSGRILFALLVAVTALAGWTVALSHGSVVRTGASVGGAVAKQTGPVAVRTVRGAAATQAAHLVQRAGSATRAVSSVRGIGDDVAAGASSAPLLAAIAGLVVAGLVRGGFATRRPVPVLVSTARSSRRGRAPPTGTPAPA